MVSLRQVLMWCRGRSKCRCKGKGSGRPPAAQMQAPVKFEVEKPQRQPWGWVDAGGGGSNRVSAISTLAPLPRRLLPHLALHCFPPKVEDIKTRKNSINVPVCLAFVAGSSSSSSP